MCPPSTLTVTLQFKLQCCTVSSLLNCSFPDPSQGRRLRVPGEQLRSIKGTTVPKLCTWIIDRDTAAGTPDRTSHQPPATPPCRQANHNTREGRSLNRRISCLLHEHSEIKSEVDVLVSSGRMHRTRGVC